MAQINLLNPTPNVSGSSRVTGTGQLWTGLYRVSVLLLVIVVIGYIGLAVLAARSRTQAAKLAMSIENAQKSLLVDPDRNLVVVRQAQLKQLQELQTKRQLWSRFFPTLTTLTLQTASYSTVQADGAGKLSVNVIVPDYASADRYLQVFSLPKFVNDFSSVKVTSLSQTQADDRAQVQMRVQAQFDPKQVLAGKNTQ